MTMIGDDVAGAAPQCCADVMIDSGDFRRWPTQDLLTGSKTVCFQGTTKTKISIWLNNTRCRAIARSPMLFSNNSGSPGLVLDHRAD
jgi:hypothetical protein